MEELAHVRDVADQPRQPERVAVWESVDLAFDVTKRESKRQPVREPERIAVGVCAMMMVRLYARATATDPP